MLNLNSLKTITIGKARQPYINLLKKLILNSVYHPGKHVKDGYHWPECPAMSMIGSKRLDNVEKLTLDVLKRGVRGHFIEAGIWKGGVVALIAGILRACKIKNKIVYGADSFIGIPPAKPDIYPADAPHVGCDKLEILSNNSKKEVKGYLKRLGLWDSVNIKFLEGWFIDTLPTLGNEKFALIRLDGDSYESTSQALKYLEPQLSKGGYVIIDDYYSWTGCKAATDEYREKNKINSKLVKIDWTAVYWKK